MRYICTRCKQTSIDGNLWCQEVDCPAGASPYLLVYGDMLGNIKVLELLRVLPHATLYKAERDDETFFLKVANPGNHNIKYLRREADVFKTLTEKGGHDSIPIWRKHGAVDSQKSYGRVTARGHLRHYLLFDFVDGAFVSDMLLDNPQPWHVHVGWFMLTLAEVVALINQRTKRLHLNLSPDTIYLRYNNLGVPQPYLLDLGLQLRVNTSPLTDEAEELQRYIQPSYRPPELIRTGELTERSDVYQLALVMHEMLEGKPTYNQQMRQDSEIHADIIQINPTVTRQDLPAIPQRDNQKTDRRSTLKMMVEEDLRYAPGERRHATAAHMYKELKAVYGEVQDKREFSFARLGKRVASSFALIAAGAVVLFTIVMLIIALTSPRSFG